MTVFLMIAINDLTKVLGIYWIALVLRMCVQERGIYYKVLRIRKQSFHLLLELLKHHILNSSNTQKATFLLKNQSYFLDVH